jgi:glyoxylase-like metal-dependent hydrolase (beta-lactamase superfamily II)
MLHGPNTNMALQIGPSGVLVVDTMYAQLAGRIIAEIRKLSDKPLRYVLNTSADLHHVGGNYALNRAGQPIVGGNLGAAAAARGAAMVAHENVLNRMSAPSGQVPPFPEGWWPMTTYFEGNKEIHFNGEAVILLQHKAHSDGDSIVHFRGSDVIATGDIFNTATYPAINLAAGGSVNGEIAALNQILDIAIPEHEQEGGTLIIPGSGRLAEEHDVLEYRDMVTIVRDRVQAMILKNMTLDQAQAANPTREYDSRWGSKTGPWTTSMFVESVFKSLKK